MIFPDESGDYLSEREQRIMISTVQWIGSPVGQSFIRSLGYCDAEEFVPREHLFSQQIADLQKQLGCIPKWIKAIFKAK